MLKFLDVEVFETQFLDCQVHKCERALTVAGWTRWELCFKRVGPNDCWRCRNPLVLGQIWSKRQTRAEASLLNAIDAPRLPDYQRMSRLTPPGPSPTHSLVRT